MEDTSENKAVKHKKHISAGLVAHVDAGKTTLAEAILYLTGRIRRLGRVDHQDAFLDNFELERSRGITIFSKQAQVMLGDVSVTFLDTPGHVDFSAEMERALSVLDYAILVIGGTAGVQSHVETLWRLLARYGVPVFLFVNKMDQPGTDHTALYAELCRKLDERCVDFTLAPDSEAFQESLAMCDEKRLEAYLSGKMADEEELRTLIAARQIFPCYFGSALRLQGVKELLDGLRRYSVPKEYPPAFGARVYKISRDAQGNRLTHMKITGGRLRVKDVLTNRQASDGTVEKPENGKAIVREKQGEIWEQKVNQIRIFSGAEYQTAAEAEAGMICAVTGLDSTYAGQGLGCEPEGELPVLEPVLSYRIELPEGTDVHQAFRRLRQLEEEEPQLHLAWDGQSGEIHAQLMGEVQIEILQNMIRERFGLDVSFGEGSIVYRETIAAPVVGMGHFEPLRHYAEVHLLLEPGERGSGLQFESICSTDALELNWQRLILTHLEEKRHPGVLTGSEITDMKITLVAGRAHLKHTEGGDFRQATYRALRNGLCRAESVLLEPVCEFRLELPAESAGRALSDIRRMYGTADGPKLNCAGDIAVITGTAPVATIRGYQSELLAYTKGRGRFSSRLKGYEPCHNAQEVIASRGYDAQADTDNPCGSVFCAHGAGFTVSWDQVPDYIHIPDTDAFALNRNAGDTSDIPGNAAGVNRKAGVSANISGIQRVGASRAVDDDELRAIFERTYGTASRESKRFRYSKGAHSGSAWAGHEAARSGRQREPAEECLLVDGYNIIFAWEELAELAKVSLDGARGRLLDLMSNYQGYKNIRLIVVFDAYRVAGHATEVQRYHNIYVVYTKEAETADQYIEKTVREIGHSYHVTVATSDALEQVIILGAGAVRLSARGLQEELMLMQQDLHANYLGRSAKEGKAYLLDGQKSLRDAVPGDGEEA